MYMYTPGHCRPISTGIFLPEQRVTSKQLMEEIDIERFGFATDWMDKAMGIHERRIAPQAMKSSEMAIAAAQSALQKVSLSPKDIDLIIFAGIDRDFSEPGSAHIVQNTIEADNAICFDVTNACHSFINGIHIADALIATGQARYALIVTGEQPSRVLRRVVDLLKNSRDRKEIISLIGGLTVGDAGAAMLIGPKLGPDSGFVGFMLNSKGSHHDQCVWGSGDNQNGHMDMQAIVRSSMKMHKTMYVDAMAKLKWLPEQIDHFIHHQAGLRLFRQHAAYTKIPRDLMSETVSWLGNITSATIPVNLHVLNENKTINNGDRVFISGTGSGLSISQTGLVWDAA